MISNNQRYSDLTFWRYYDTVPYMSIRKTYIQRMNATKRTSIRSVTEMRKDNRESASNRGYGRRWQKIRKLFLDKPENKICSASGCREPSFEVHHIVPLAAGGTHSEDNLQGLCKSCHSRITLRSVHNAKKQR